MTANAHVQGEPFPELAKDTLRLYSMRFCPFAERARLVLAHKHIPYELININLQKKPDWFLALNPNGSTPTLQCNEQVLWESAIVAEYLDEAYPDCPLSPTDPYIKAKHKILVENWGSKVCAPYMKFIKGSEEDKVKAKVDIIKGLELFEQTLQANFYGGDSIVLLDLLLWPIVERFPMVEALCDFNPLPQDKFPKMCAWVARMHKDVSAVQAAALPTQTHVDFIKTLFKGEPNVDIGL